RNSGSHTRLVDFGSGPVNAMRFEAPDSFVVARTTGVRDVTAYVALPIMLRVGDRLLPIMSPLLRSATVRRLVQGLMPRAPSANARARTVTHVWAEARDDQGTVVEARVHGPEAGLEWTA